MKKKSTSVVKVEWLLLKYSTSTILDYYMHQ